MVPAVAAVSRRGPDRLWRTRILGTSAKRDLMMGRGSVSSHTWASKATVDRISRSSATLRPPVIRRESLTRSTRSRKRTCSALGIRRGPLETTPGGSPSPQNPRSLGWGANRISVPSRSHHLWRSDIRCTSVCDHGLSVWRRIRPRRRHSSRAWRSPRRGTPMGRPTANHRYGDSTTHGRRGFTRRAARDLAEARPPAPALAVCRQDPPGQSTVRSGQPEWSTGRAGLHQSPLA